MRGGPPLGIYIHWPWCLSKCPYCDFNSQPIDPKSIDQESYRAALLAELDHSLNETDRRVVGSVFFGGGTPSLMAPGTVAALLEKLAKRRGLAKGLEVTLEVNPGTVSPKSLDEFRAAGVTRLSLGVQSLEDQSLKALGRLHDARAALKALDLIQKRFDRVSIDLIYGRPGQKLADWRAELAQALDLGLSHYSLYQLTYEPGTPLGRAAHSSEIEPIDGDLEAEFYAQTLEQMADAGRPAYEISNFAVPGQACRHNRDIWRGGAYIGIGPGAHGRESRSGQIFATERKPDPAQWLRQVQDRGHGYSTCAQLLPGERAQELLLLGLRLTEGIDRKLYNRLTGFDISEVISPQAAARLAEDGYIRQTPARLRTTDKGRLLLDSITLLLLSESP